MAIAAATMRPTISGFFSVSRVPPRPAMPLRTGPPDARAAELMSRRARGFLPAAWASFETARDGCWRRRQGRPALTSGPASGAKRAPEVLARNSSSVSTLRQDEDSNCFPGKTLIAWRFRADAERCQERQSYFSFRSSHPASGRLLTLAGSLNQ